MAKIVVKKKLRLKVEERLWFFIKYITLKQTPIILKNISIGKHLKLGTIYICLLANKYVHWVNEWRFNIYREWWMFNTNSRHKILLKTRLCCFLAHVNFREESENDENTYNAINT